MVRKLPHNGVFMLPDSDSDSYADSIGLELDVIVLLRRVYSGPVPIPILIPIPMQMVTVPNLTQILIGTNKVVFLSNFHQNHHRNQSQCNLSAYYWNQNQNRNWHRSRAVEAHHNIM